MTAERIPSLPPSLSTAAAHALVNAELSSRARYGHVALLLSAAAMTAVIGALWTTEPSLPWRTHLAFGVLIAIGLSWIAYATWVLTNRRVLLGQHRVVAGTMAVTFTAVFVAGSLLTAISTGHAAGYMAAAFGAGMLVIAAGLLVRARRHVARLTARRQELERQRRP